MHDNGPILIAYDGSTSADFAIDEAAMLATSGAKAIVVYVREPLEGLAAHLEGHPVLEEVKSFEAGIVLGSRGRRGVKSLLLGSVSHHVRRPALVIPSPSLAEARQRLANVNGENLSLAG